MPDARWSIVYHRTKITIVICKKIITFVVTDVREDDLSADRKYEIYNDILSHQLRSYLSANAIRK